jgi:hypothetical protein
MNEISSGTCPVASRLLHERSSASGFVIRVLLFSKFSYCIIFGVLILIYNYTSITFPEWFPNALVLGGFNVRRK